MSLKEIENEWQAVELLRNDEPHRTYAIQRQSSNFAWAYAERFLDLAKAVEQALLKGVAKDNGDLLLSRKQHAELMTAMINLETVIPVPGLSNSLSGRESPQVNDLNT